MLYQPPRLQYIFLILVHCYISIFGNRSITKYMTHIYRHIALKNMVAVMVFLNMLDMIWPSRYLLMKPIRSSLVTTFAMMINPRNSILALALFVGRAYPLVKSCPERDNQSVLCLGDSSRKDEQNKKFLMDENLPKEKTYGKTGETNAPKFLFWIHLILLIAHFLCHPEKMANISGSILLKWLMTMHFFNKKTLVTPSSYVLLIIINTNILFHTNTLPITLQTKRMKWLCGNSNILFTMRFHLKTPIPNTKYIVIMWWLNGI